jgi:phosphatidylinositol alpha-mannosyltransferase
MSPAAPRSSTWAKASRSLARTGAAIRLLGDPQRRRELSERGTAHVRRFDWSTVGADILAVYETVTDGAASVAADERTGLRARLGLARE